MKVPLTAQSRSIAPSAPAWHLRKKVEVACNQEGVLPHSVGAVSTRVGVQFRLSCLTTCMVAESLLKGDFEEIRGEIGTGRIAAQGRVERHGNA